MQMQHSANIHVAIAKYAYISTSQAPIQVLMHIMACCSSLQANIVPRGHSMTVKCPIPLTPSTQLKAMRSQLFISTHSLPLSTSESQGQQWSARHIARRNGSGCWHVLSNRVRGEERPWNLRKVLRWELRTVRRRIAYFVFVTRFHASNLFVSLLLLILFSGPCRLHFAV